MAETLTSVEPVRRVLPATVLANAERMIELLEQGLPYHKAQRESGLLAGQVTAIYDHAPEMRERIEIACTSFKKQAKHLILQKAVDQVLNGQKKQTIDKDGCVQDLYDDVPVQAQVALLEGIDKDFSRQGSDDGSNGNGRPTLTMNFNLTENVMMSIRAGNADVVENLAKRALDRQAEKAARIVDIVAVEESKQ